MEGGAIVFCMEVLNRMLNACLSGGKKMGKMNERTSAAPIEDLGDDAVV